MAGLEEFIRWNMHEPEAWIEFRTLEIFHPQEGNAYRFINQYEDKLLTLEAGAPRDASAQVNFVSKGLNITDPGERQDGEQVLTVKFSTVDSTVQDILAGISGQGYLTPIEVIYRKYYSGDLTQPAATPLYLSAAQINFDSAMVVNFSAEDTNLTTKRVGIIYTTELFPGMGE